MAITITEALAEIKTIQKRITKKRETITTYLSRQEGLKDPLDKGGGSVKVIAAERQAIADLEARIVELRRGIQNANDVTDVAINGTTRTISDWLTWRREVAPGQSVFLGLLRNRLSLVREQARRQGASVISAVSQNVNVAADKKDVDIVVNISEKELADEIEALEETLGQLDGQLSLKNATTPIAEAA